MPETIVLKFAARKALKDHWSTALLVGLVVAFPTLLGQMLMVLSGGSFALRLTNLVETATRSQLQNPFFLLAEMMKIVNDKGFQTAVIVQVVAWLVTPALALGLLKHLFGLLRGEEGTFTDIFSRIRQWWKAILLNLLCTFKMLLWAVPGLAVVVGGAYLTVTTGNMSFLYMMYVGYGIAMVLGLMAFLRYALSQYALADEPDSGILSSLRTSKALMKKNQGKLISVYFTYIWSMLLISMVVTWVSVMNNVIGNTLSMALTLVLDVYIRTLVCAFYLRRRGRLQVVIPGMDGNPFGGADDEGDKQEKKQNDDLNSMDWYKH